MGQKTTRQTHSGLKCDYRAKGLGQLPPSGAYLEMKVKIKNRKNKRKSLTGFTLQTKGGGVPANFDTAVMREVQRRTQTHPILRNNSIIEPRATVSGWMVYALPQQQIPGEPMFTFSVTDELNIEYVGRQR